MENKYPEFEYLISAHYHQDTWVDFDSHIAVWEDYAKCIKDEELEALFSEIQALLKLPPQEVMKFIADKESGGLYLENEEEYLQWITSLKKFLEKKSSSSDSLT